VAKRSSGVDDIVFTARRQGAHYRGLSGYFFAGVAWQTRSNRAISCSVVYVIPVTVDDLAANGLLEEAHPQVCWERSIETLTARKDDIEGFAVASDERIEAYLLYARTPTPEILSLRSFVEDDGARLKQLLARLDEGTFRFPKVHPAEISKSSWRRSVSVPPAGICCSQRGRNPLSRGRSRHSPRSRDGR
jgi:hypothetical protein